MPAVPEAHMCSVRALSVRGLMPSASAASEEMWLWNAVRSGMTDPTTRPSTSFGVSPGTESKHALPASHTRSRYVALRTPNFDTPAPTSATFLMGPSRGRGEAAVDVDDLPRHVRRVVRGEERMDGGDLARLG